MINVEKTGDSLRLIPKPILEVQVYGFFSAGNGGSHIRGKLMASEVILRQDRV